jgi:hypothetical protein
MQSSVPTIAFMCVDQRNSGGYLVMICRGHVPVIGRGDQGAPIN